MADQKNGWDTLRRSIKEQETVPGDEDFKTYLLGLEKFIGHLIPSEYFAFLVHVNGGRITDKLDSFTVIDPYRSEIANPQKIDHLFGIYQNPRIKNTTY